MAAAKATERVCADCGLPKVTMFAMRPGKDGEDGEEWYICGRCWVDGKNTRFHRPNPKEPTMISSEMASALVNSGWTVKSNGDGTETITAPDRPPPPRRRRA